MYFKRLPKHIQEGIKYLAIDDVFQKQINEDKILEQLYDQEIDYEFEKQCTLTALDIPIKLHGHKFKALTPLAWQILWTYRSPIVTGKLNELQTSDIDLFFYLLETPDPMDCIDKSKDFFLNNYNDIIEFIPDILDRIIKIAFFPLSLFPVGKSGNADPVYDVDWLMQLIVVATKMTNMTLDEAMKKPMMTICSLRVQYAKLNGVQNIERTPPQEVLAQEDYRICELIINRLEELHILRDGDSKEELLKLMTEKELQNE